MSVLGELECGDLPRSLPLLSNSRLQSNISWRRYDTGKYRDEPVLPFNAFGTMAMARRESEPNSASSQFFFLLKVRRRLRVVDYRV